MKIYMAPLEGITSYIFRNAFAKYYGGIDRYFTPFITPHPKKGFSPSEKRDILPENNTKITVIPQILTNQVDDFVKLSRLSIKDSDLKEKGLRSFGRCRGA